MAEKYCFHCMEELSRDMNFCTNCGKSLEIRVRPYQLKPGTVLNGRYLVGDIIGRGGFGVTYLGRDLNLDIKVAIKEYFPSGYAERHNSVTSALVVTDEAKVDFFERQKSNFLQEARSIAKFSSEKGIVDVKDYFEDNNTAYIIMEYLDGINLSDYIKENGTIPARKMFSLMLPVMESLKRVNAENIIHRDITPDNIMVMKDGTVKLMDFGSARYLNSTADEMTVMLKQGYAPEEQYRSDISDQGPWTDVYGLCASMYKCITGITPQSALDRLSNDRLRKPSDMGISIDPDLEKILMYGLQVRKENRCRDMSELHSLCERVLSGLPLSRTQSSNEIYSHSRSGSYGDDDMYNNYQDEDDVPTDPYTQQKKTNKGLIALVVTIVSLVVIAGIVILVVSLNANKGGKGATANTLQTATAETVTQETKESVQPSTEAPRTEAPTEAPQTEAPTEAPQTEEPSLEPYTEEPVTEEPDATLEPFPEADESEEVILEEE